VKKVKVHPDGASYNMNMTQNLILSFLHIIYRLNKFLIFDSPPLLRIILKRNLILSQFSKV